MFYDSCLLFFTLLTKHMPSLKSVIIFFCIFCSLVLRQLFTLVFYFLLFSEITSSFKPFSIFFMYIIFSMFYDSCLLFLTLLTQPTFSLNSLVNFFLLVLFSIFMSSLNLFCSDRLLRYTAYSLCNFYSFYLLFFSLFLFFVKLKVICNSFSSDFQKDFRYKDHFQFSYSKNTVLESN